MLIEVDAVITGADSGAVFTPGRLRVEAGRIAEVGSSSSSAGERAVRFSRPQRMTIALPGLIDCHCHLELSGLAGKIKFRRNQSLLSWLMKIVVLRPKRKGTQARWVQLGARKALAGGTTTVADISANNRSWQTLLHEPIRKVCFAEALGFGRKAGGSMDALRTRMRDMPAQSGRFWKGISPHAPYSTSEQVYREALGLAEQRGWRLMTHLAEDKAEVEFLRSGRGPWRTVLRALGAWDDRYEPCGLSPVAWANGLGLLDYPTLLAHVNFVRDDDIPLLASGRASVVYCPLAHRYFHHPPHRYRDLLAAGVNVVLGCDSLACSESLSILDQLRYVYRQGGLSAPALLAMATRRAAEALGLQEHLGTLEPGKHADMIVLSTARKRFSDPWTAVLDPETDIIAVMINGVLFSDVPNVPLASTAVAP